MIDRLEKGAERLGLNELGGRPLQIAQLFGIPGEVRVINASEIVFPDQRHLTLTFSINSTDIVMTETKKMSDGTSLLTAFHTDLSLILRGVASGADVNSLNLVPTDADSVSAFRQVLLTWDRHLSRGW